MRTRTSWGRRLAFGVGATAALLCGVGGTASGQSVERAPRPTQEAPPNEQSGDPAAPFHGYVGYAGAKGVKASTTPPPKSDGAKRERLGPIGTNSPHSQDVPGQPVQQVDDSAFTSIALPKRPDPTQTAAVRSEVDAEGTARVIVAMRTPMHLEADLSASQVDAQHDAIAASLDGLAGTLAKTGSTKLDELQVVPSAVYEVTPAGLDALLADPNVASVVLDREVHGELASSTAVIDSDLLNRAGVDGRNFEGNTNGGRYQVAIIDSGVDGQHNAFTGRIVSSACFVTDSSCLGNANSSTAPGSAEECTHSNDCDHGTHVAGIAAGNSFPGGHEGVARGAGIVAIKVAEDSPTSPRWTAQFSSINNALSRVIALKTSTNPNIVSVNLSIGTQQTFTFGDPACNAQNPTTGMLFGQLQSLGVAVLVAAGNNGSNNSMSFPGCASNAFAIGATNDADVPAGFTNSSAGLRWWAPGVSIDAPVPGNIGNNVGNKDGTSMATPHVVGAFALLRECVDSNGHPITNAKAASDLDATGVNVTRNGVTRKRINVLDAATRNVNNNDFAAPEALAGNGPINDFDFNVCADSEAGEPGPFTVDNSIWWTWTPATTGTATISTEDGGGHVTTFDTQLSVYTGNSLGSLNLIAADDDSGTGLRSLVTIPVNGGTTYRIKVDGFAAFNGLLNLHIQNGPPPQCFFVPATIVGTAGNDVINGTAGPDVVVAGDGNDTINGFDGNDRVCAGSGNDVVNGGNGADFVLGDPGADTLNGGNDDDSLTGNVGLGNINDLGDTINGEAGNDFIDGWVGNDVLNGGPGNDQLRGEADVDTVTYATAPAGVSASLTSNTATGDGNDSLVNVENLAGSAFNDVLEGGAGNNVLFGRTGDDRLMGRLGNDALLGDAGVDTASFATAPGAVVANLITGTATGEGTDALNGMENLIGSPFNDDLVGSVGSNFILGQNGNDLLRGFDGDDRLDGGLGIDVLNGGKGTDVLSGRQGNDSYIGGGGFDMANFSGAPAGVAVNLTAGTALGEGADVLANVENVNGSPFDDIITGDGVPNLINAQAGNDRIRGLGANDILVGGPNADLIAGGDGNDQLIGAAGNDRLFGEAGNDSHNGGAGNDLCNGGAGLDAQVLCEAIIGIP